MAKPKLDYGELVERLEAREGAAIPGGEGFTVYDDLLNTNTTTGYAVMSPQLVNPVVGTVTPGQNLYANANGVGTVSVSNLNLPKIQVTYRKALNYQKNLKK